MNMKFFYAHLLYTALLTNVASAKAETIKFKAPLREAQVFYSGANLHHHITVALPAGQHELVLTNLANRIEEQSIQLTVPEGISILSIKLAEKTPRDNSKQEVQDSGTVKQAKQDLSQLSNQELAERQTLEMIENAVKNLQLGDKGVSVKEFEELANYYKQQQIAIRKQLELITAQKIKLSNLISQLEKENGTDYANNNLVIHVQVLVKQPTNAILKLNYFTPNAIWMPQFDVKVQDTKGKVTIVHKADIQQYTGLNWDKIKLSLSTNDPSVSGNIPTLRPYYLNQPNPSNNYARKMTITDALAGTAAGISVLESGQPGSAQDVLLRGAGSLEATNAPLIVLDGAPYSGSLTTINPWDIEELRVLKDATSKAVYGARAVNGVVHITTKKNSNNDKEPITHIEEQINDFVYEITNPYDIPSDSNIHTAYINEYHQEAKYEYLLFPKVARTAYLSAKFLRSNPWSEQMKTASIIFKETYKGKTYLNSTSSLDSLQISLGMDNSIISKREKTKDVLSNNHKKRTITIETEIKNAKPFAVAMVVKDNIPLSPNPYWEIELTDKSDALYDKEKGSLEWKLLIPANSSRILSFTYTIKTAKGFATAGR
jgi:TonB-dependent SusC/RagA subfamily outer membrane receptor